MGSRARACTVLAAALLLSLPAVAAAAQDEAAQVPAPGLAITADDERPLRGQVVRLTVTEDGRPAAGARVTAHYRPNSQTAKKAELAPVDSSGTVLWTPELPGPVTLEVRPAGSPPEAEAPPAAALTVAVRYGRLLPSGLFIMVLAGVLLFGGAAWAMYLLLHGPEPVPDTEPPST